MEASTNFERLALAPCWGKSGSSRHSRTMVLLPLDPPGRVIGRLDILCVLYQNCACTPSIITSSRGDKCKSCTSVTQWALRNLSRKMLLVEQGNNNTLALHCPPSCILQIDGHEIQTSSSDNGSYWQASYKIHKGSEIILQKKKATDNLYLRLEVVGLEEDALPAKSPQVDSDLRETITNPNNPEFRIYLFPIGRDMSSTVRRIYSSRIEQAPNAELVSNWKLATHWVISDQMGRPWQDSAMQHCNLSSRETLEAFVEEKGLVICKPSWLGNTPSYGDSLVPPSLTEVWNAVPITNIHNKRSKSSDLSQAAVGPRNVELANAFKRLAKLYRKMPLLEDDSWKAYCFDVVAGRLQCLDFEVSLEPQSIQRLKSIKGIGARSVDKIIEFLETGSISRIDEMEKDPLRLAVRNMMYVWGVGQKRASELVHQGIHDIDQLRNAIRQESIELDRNQLVGVECYEDIAERMSREEVEKIGADIKEMFEKVFPKVEVSIQGSYRRLSEACGDVDVHVTHPDFHESVPSTALGKVVDELYAQGKLEFHLTYLAGMATGLKWEDFSSRSKHVPKDVWARAKKPNSSKSDSYRHSGSYMGVWNSPTVPGRRRRVDIKLYPYRERVFASIYFTGNGHFNRSIRLWAARKFGYTLSDHGLFERGTLKRVMSADNEKQVFDKLGIVYKPPHERLSFDSVVSINGENMGDIEISASEFRMVDRADMSESD